MFAADTAESGMAHIFHKYGQRRGVYRVRSQYDVSGGAMLFPLHPASSFKTGRRKSTIGQRSKSSLPKGLRLAGSPSTSLQRDPLGRRDVLVTGRAHHLPCRLLHPRTSLSVRRRCASARARGPACASAANIVGNPGTNPTHLDAADHGSETRLDRVDTTDLRPCESPHCA